MMRTLVLTALIGCQPGLDGAEGDLVGPYPDFALEDVNPTSSRHAEAVSPRDYLGQVSAWYFGHAG